MGDFPYLEWLCRLYMDRAKHSRRDTDYLKAHRLANACVARDESEHRFKLVYEVEKDWYNGKHPCKNWKELYEVTKEHRKILSDIRKEAASKLREITPDKETLTVDNILSKEHENKLQMFSDDVFSVCQRLSEEFKRFLQTVVQSSVKYVHDLPCLFAVIELWSLACGETTSYNGLDLALIVENERHVEYFTRLSTEICFRIANLRETPVKLFGVDELVGCELSDGYDVVGFHVTGTLPIQTVEGMVEKCKESIELLSGHTPSVLIHTPAGRGQMMYNRFSTKLADEISAARNGDKESFMTLIYSKLIHYIKDYRFVHKFNLHPLTTDNVHSQIKCDKLMYFVQVLKQLKKLLDIKTIYSWDTLHEFFSLQLISENDQSHVTLMLSLSLYILTSSVLSLGEQPDYLALHSADTNVSYHIPCELYISLGYLLMSIPKSMSDHVSIPPLSNSPLSSDTAVQFVKPIMNDLVVEGEPDFMLEVELLLFAKDYKSALDVLCLAVGKRKLVKCEKFISEICSHYGLDKSSSLTERYCEMCFKVLFSCQRYTVSVEYVKWLVSNNSCSMSSLHQWKDFVFKCHELQVHHKGAKLIIDQLLKLVKVKLNLKDNASLVELIEYLKVNKDTSKSMCCLVGDLCRYYGDLSRYLQEFDGSVSYYESALSLFELFDSEFVYKEGILAVLNQTGLIYYKMNKYTKSLEFYKKSLKMAVSLYGDTNHEKIATVYNNIATTHGGIGDYTAAIEYHNMAIDIEKHLYGESSLQIASSYCNIGQLYARKGEYAKSLEYHFNSLGIHMSAHGRQVNHPDIADDYNYIGNVYSSMGNYTLSLEYHKKSFDMKIALFGESDSHIEIFTAYNNLAYIYSSMGDYKTSVDYYKQSLAMVKRLYGDNNADHPSIALSYDNIGGVYSNMGEYAKSMDFYTMSLEMRQRLYVDTVNHPDIATSYSSIGSFYCDTGEYTESVKWYMKCLNMRKALNGNGDHPVIAVIYNNIGYVYALMGEYVKSLDYHTKCLDMKRALYNHTKVHPDIASSYSNIGYMYLLMGLYPTAETYLTKALDMRIKLHGKDTNHPSVASSYTNIGRVYSKTFKYTEAMEYLKTALDMFKNLYGEDANHSSIAFIYRYFGETYTAMNDDTKDVQYHVQSMCMLKKLYSETHPDIARAYSSMGRMYSSKCRHEDSLQCHEKSLSIRQVLYGNDNHPDVAQNYYDLGNTYSVMANQSESPTDCYTKAYDFFTKSLMMRKALFGEDTDHPDIAESCNKVSRVRMMMGHRRGSPENPINGVFMMQAILKKFVKNVNLV